MSTTYLLTDGSTFFHYQDAGQEFHAIQITKAGLYWPLKIKIKSHANPQKYKALLKILTYQQQAEI